MSFANARATSTNYTADEFHQNDLTNFSGAGVLPLWWTGYTLMALVPNEMLYYPPVDSGYNRIHLLGGTAMRNNELKQYFGNYTENGLILTAIQELWEETGMMNSFGGQPVMKGIKWNLSVKQEWVDWLQQSWKMWYALGSYGLYVPICDARWVSFFNEAITKYVHGGKKEANYLVWADVQDLQNNEAILTRGGVHRRSNLLSGILQSLLKDQFVNFKTPANIVPYPERQIIPMQIPPLAKEKLRSGTAKWQAATRTSATEIKYPNDLSVFAVLGGDNMVRVDARFIDKAINLVIEGGF